MERKQFRKRFPKKKKEEKKKARRKKKYASYNTTVWSVRARRIEIRVVCRPLENFVLFLSFSLRVSEHERVARKWERVRGKVPSPFLSSFFFLSPFLLSLSTSQVEIGRASKAPNNTQSRSRLLPLPPLDIQAKWNAFVALRYRSTRVTHFISIQRGSVRLWPVLSRWQNGW